MSAKRNTRAGDRLDVLVTLVEAWERQHYPIDLPDPVEAIKYHMDQNGLQPRHLIPFIGSRNRVHEVLNRRRPLTLKMIWRLHEGLGIPAEHQSSARSRGLRYPTTRPVGAPAADDASVVDAVS
jgi:HTH-type transcriptional regulator/antitoxin HigA